MRTQNRSGTTEYSKVVKIVREDAISTSVYPNPASGTMKLYLNGYTPGEYRMVIYNTAGQTLKNGSLEVMGSGQLNKDLDLSDLKAGLYYLMIRDRDGLIVGKQTLTVR